MFWIWLTQASWNNIFAYEQRKLVESQPQLWIPELKTINDVKEITLGTKTVFCECDEQWTIQQFTGLEYIYQIMSDQSWIHCPVYIFDNHNYALYFWAIQRKTLDTPPHVIHIDQHSDLGATPTSGILPHLMSGTDKQWFDYAVKTCNVGNFINPALESGIIWSCNWIKNQYNLEQLSLTHSPASPYWLDIDLDFWAPGMGTDLAKTVPIVRSLMREASLITIATSPYFLDQAYAITLLEQLLYDKHSG